jgi:hypothetical protein
MNSRLAAVTALCREVALPASVLTFAAFGCAGINNTGAAPIIDHLAPFLSADATVALVAAPKVADKLPLIAADAADVETASRSVTEAPTADATPAGHEPEPIVAAALTDSSEMLRPETPPEPVAKMNLMPGDRPAASATGR